MSLLLTGADIAALMTPGDYLSAVETAFAAGPRAHCPPPMHLHGRNGAFHAKGATMEGARPLAALKLNGNFPDNPRRGLPTIQGVLMLCDAENGEVLALMDSIEITLRRTAAATALAAKRLARPASLTFAICGCGAQARAHVEALAPLFAWRRGFAWDLDSARAAAFASEMETATGIPIEATATLAAATSEVDVIVTCTTARKAFLSEADVQRGVFIAAVGADSPAKSEIAPSLMGKSKVVVDVLEQCLAMGDLHHAVNAGAMSRSSVHADLTQIVTGAKWGRTSRDETIVFDSTGTAIQDVASAAIVFERACARGVGQRVQFA